MKIQNLLSENTTLVEMYFTKAPKDSQVIDIHAPDAVISKIQEKYKSCKTTKYMAYCKNELTYLYDLTDDHQIVFSKLKDKDASDSNIYAISYKYSKLPTHLFPCVSDIDYIMEYTLAEYKLTNRLSIIIRTDDHGTYAYIEYKHSPNVDIDKIESHISMLLNIVQSI